MGFLLKLVLIGLIGACFSQTVWKDAPNANNCPLEEFTVEEFKDAMEKGRTWAYCKLYKEKWCQQCSDYSLGSFRTIQDKQTNGHLVQYCKQEGSETLYCQRFNSLHKGIRSQLVRGVISYDVFMYGDGDMFQSLIIQEAMANNEDFKLATLQDGCTKARLACAGIYRHTKWCNDDRFHRIVRHFCKYYDDLDRAGRKSMENRYRNFRLLAQGRLEPVYGNAATPNSQSLDRLFALAVNALDSPFMGDFCRHTAEFSIPDRDTFCDDRRARNRFSAVQAAYRQYKRCRSEGNISCPIDVSKYQTAQLTFLETKIPAK